MVKMNINMRIYISCVSNSASNIIGTSEHKIIGKVRGNTEEDLREDGWTK